MPLELPLDVRLIPAHAGKTEAENVEAFHDAAHPRSRGENSMIFVIISRSRGSSPLTRGKPDERRGHAFGVGLIPAHAGKTRT